MPLRLKLISTHSLKKNGFQGKMEIIDWTKWNEQKSLKLFLMFYMFLIYVALINVNTKLKNIHKKNGQYRNFPMF